MTKAKPLSTANTPNDLDPAVVDKLAELDRTDPIDAYSSETLDRMDDLIQKMIAEETDPPPVSEEELQKAHAAQWTETFGGTTDPGPTGLDFEAAMKLEGEQPIPNARSPDFDVLIDGQEEWIRGNTVFSEGGLLGDSYPNLISETVRRFKMTGDEPNALADRLVRDGYGQTANPYILESNTVLNDLRSAANQARRTIAALDREIDDLDRTADEQIALINARRDANKAQREKRKEDLMKIVAADAMVNGQPQEQGE